MNVRFSRIGFAALVCFALLTALLSSSAQGPIDPTPVPRAMDPPIRTTGFVPPSVDLSHVGRRATQLGIEPEALPSSFDWRSKDGSNYLTSVKDQGSCGSCYSFAAVANFESRLLIDGAGPADLSENQVKECNWRELNNYESPPLSPWGSCDGGNYFMVANLLAKKGTVTEACDPYVAADVSCTPGCPYQQTLLDWRILSGDSVPDTDLLKGYIHNHGPVYTSVYVGIPGTSWYNEFVHYDGSYTLYYGGLGTTNHAVLIVGWDDTVSHSGGTGGWIVKNSWGTDWGDNGYFSIAYGSAGIGKYASTVTDWQGYDAGGELLYYDQDGWTASWGFGSPTAWGMAVFTATTGSYATRVEFWTTDATTDVDVYVYDDLSGSTPQNLLGSSLDHSYGEPGYHSVELSPSIDLSPGDDVAVVVKFGNDAYTYPLPADSHGPLDGSTYKSGNGSSWMPADPDIGIRLRTSAQPAPGVTSISPPTGVNTGTVSASVYGTAFQSGASVKLTRPNHPDIEGTSVNVTGAYTVTCDLGLTGAATGPWDVVVTNPDARSGALSGGFLVTGSPTAPTVTSIMPATGVNTGTVEVALSGTNFQPGADVELTRVGQEPVGAGEVTVASSTQITCELNLSGVTTGLWNVVVTNPDTQKGTLTNGFTVVSGADDVYLPVVLNEHPEPAVLWVQNDLGTTLNLAIVGVGSADVPTGLHYWGSFPPGTYSYQVTASGYYPLNGRRSFGAGLTTWRFYPAQSASLDGPDQVGTALQAR